MRVYKFYKDNCPPCYALTRMLNHIGTIDGIEIVNKNVILEENNIFAKSNGIDKVPALMFENGNKIIGQKTEQEVREFLMLRGQL